MFAATFATPPALDEITRYLLDTANVHAARTIAIDGVDGVGKTTFADLLAARLRSQRQAVHRISIDDFHFPRERADMLVDANDPVRAHVVRMPAAEDRQ